MLVHNYHFSRLDYCNSLYYGLPISLSEKLQLVMNRAPRLIKGLPPRERIIPTLIDLHWLPIRQEYITKCVMVYQALRFGEPRYIRDPLLDFHVD